VHHATSEALIGAQSLGFSGNPTVGGNNQARSDAFVGIIPVLIKAAKFLLLMVMVLLSSLFLYGLFYVAIMPGHSAAEKLYFDYSGIAKHPVFNNPVRPVLPKTHFRYQNPHSLNNAPWAVADFFSQHSQWEGYSKNSVPALLTSNCVEGRQHVPS